MIRLTERERQVAWCLVRGFTYAEAGLEIGISLHTVKFHAAHLLDKLNARTSGRAVYELLRRGIMTIDSEPLGAPPLPAQLPMPLPVTPDQLRALADALERRSA